VDARHPVDDERPVVAVGATRRVDGDRVVEALGHPVGRLAHRVEGVGRHREGAPATDAVEVDHRTNVGQVGPVGVIPGPDETDLLGAVDDELDGGVQVGLAGGERVCDFDDCGGPGAVVHRALGDVVGVDVAGDQHALAGVRSQASVDVLAGRPARFGLNADGHLGAVEPAREASAYLLADADGRHVADGVGLGTDAAGRRELAGDVISVDERRRAALDGVVVLLAAVDVPVVVVGYVAASHDDPPLDVGRLEVGGQTIAQVDERAGRVGRRTPWQGDTVLGGVAGGNLAGAARPPLDGELLETGLARARLGEGVAGQFGPAAFARAPGHPVADVDEVFEVVPACRTPEGVTDPHAMGWESTGTKRSGGPRALVPFGRVGDPRPTPARELTLR
jgi:hypothetical protein